MTPWEAFIYVVSIALFIGLITGIIVSRWGYSFARYFVTGFIAACGILGIIFKILMDYL